ncbi:class I SAM-dependent methyltransferase [Streptomyces sp. LP11]|uniref:Class I SAM-dependent methyltransferase n=1 Tax=Streptomyces pyxinicus TaxID=2970331 RepID=A0ABT2AX86_9ACTN|nr:class I SAM-dependent methyltransferase [Streptomyces sp. LP11]MCS0600868.1 class I SAM-dependent methyltransferase [Streptomyces sp. LP11]
MTTLQPPLPLTPRTADAWGQLLLDCQTAGLPRDTYFEICERDDGYISGYDAVGFFTGPDSWPELDNWAFARFHGRVLDIGVGAGRFAVPFQERGGEVVGLDVSADALDVCRRRGLARTFLGTVDDLPENQRFDTFLLLGRNLGLLESRERGSRLLSALARLARPGARIVGTGMDPYLLDGAQHAEYLAANRRRGRMSGQMRLRLRHRLLVTDWFDYLFASLPELESLTEGTGWRIAEVERRGPDYGVVLTLA